MNTTRIFTLAAIAALALSGCTSQSPADKAAAADVAAKGPITLAYSFQERRSDMVPGMPKDGEPYFTGTYDDNSNLPKLLVQLGYAKPYHNTTTTLDYNVQPARKVYYVSLALAHGIPHGWTCRPQTDEVGNKSESCAIPIGTMTAGKAQMTSVMGQTLVHFMCTPQPNALGKLLTYKGSGVSSDGIAHPGRFDGSNWRNDDGDDNGSLWTFGKAQQCTVTVRPDGSIEQ